MAESLRELKERIRILKEIEVAQGKLTQEQYEELKLLERQVAAKEKKVKLTKEETKGAFWGPGADVTVNPIGTEMTLDKSGQKVKIDKILNFVFQYFYHFMMIILIH